MMMPIGPDRDHAGEPFAHPMRQIIDRRAPEQSARDEKPPFRAAIAARGMRLVAFESRRRT